MAWAKYLYVGIAIGAHATAALLVASSTFTPRSAEQDLQPLEIALILPVPELEPEEILPPEDLSPPKIDEPPKPESEPKPSDPVEVAPVAEITELKPEDAGKDVRPPVSSTTTYLIPDTETPATTARAPEIPSVSQPSQDRGSFRQVLRGFQCARLSPSQRHLCDDEEAKQAALSSIIDEVRAAAPLTNRELSAFVRPPLSLRTANKRAASALASTGPFSAVENNSHIRQSNTGSAMTDGVLSSLNANPDPVFDGGRYDHWDSDAGAPER